MIEWLEENGPACFFKSITGIDCPGCGMTRAFIALLKGDLSGSLHYHPGLIPFLLTLIVLLLQLKIKHPRGGFLIMWLFIATSGITLINFLLKLFTPGLLG